MKIHEIDVHQKKIKCHLDEAEIEKLLCIEVAKQAGFEILTDTHVKFIVKYIDRGACGHQLECHITLINDI